MQKRFKVETILETGICLHCGFSNHRFLKKNIPLKCRYHELKSLNYLKIPDGYCAAEIADLKEFAKIAKPVITRKIDKLIK